MEKAKSLQGGMLRLKGNRDLFLLVALSLTTSPFFGILFSVYAPYLRGLGFTATEYGVLGGLSLILSLLASIIAGFLCDRVGARAVVVISSIIASVGLILLSTGFKNIAYVAVALWGFSGGLWSVSGLVLATRIPVSDGLERILSYTAAASTIGGGVGALGGWIPVVVNAYGVDIVTAYRFTILSVALLSLLPVVVIVPRIREVITGSSVEATENNRVDWGVLGRLILVNIIISLGAGASIHLIDYYFVLKFGVSSGELGTLWSVQNLVMGILMLQMPRLSSMVGGALRAYIIVASPSVLLLALLIPAQSFVIAASIYVVRSTLMNVANPLYQAFEMSLIPRRFRGRGASILSLAWQIPAGLGRSVGGALMDVNVDAPIAVTTGLYTLAFVLLIAFFPNYVLKGNPTRNETQINVSQ
ncbi:MAG: MFS transporter [Desulfurococcaceae archaeon]|nr:MFS transporter [Desulfurococcaceae archaeon]